MMCLASNQQRMYYALQNGQVPIYQTDDDGNILYYKDNEGNSYPLETGEYEVGYTEAVEFFGNIAMSGGEAKSEEYGIDVSQYDAILIVSKGQLPIDETSLIWYESEVGYKDNDKTIVDGNSADYKVLSVKPSQNIGKYVLGKLVK